MLLGFGDLTKGFDFMLAQSNLILANYSTPQYTISLVKKLHLLIFLENPALVKVLRTAFSKVMFSLILSDNKSTSSI